MPAIDPQISELHKQKPHIASKITHGSTLIIFLLIIGTTFYTFFEGLTWVDALYFSASTLTTVGYGDIVPSSDLSKLFTVVYMLVGVGMALYILSSIAGEIISKRQIQWLTRQHRIKPLNKIGGRIKKAAGKFSYNHDEVLDEKKE